MAKVQKPVARYDLTDLRVLLAVADTGSISRGGALCNLAPSSASLRILNLEEILGVPLFVRKSRGVQLTHGGLVLLEHIRKCFAQLEQMHADLAPFVGGHSAELVIMANSNALASWLPLDLQSFLAAHPGIRIKLEERSSAEIAAAVREGRAGLGIGVWNDECQDLELVQYRMDELILITPPGHRLAAQKSVRFSECVRDPFVCLQSGSSIHTFMTRTALELGRRLDVRVQVAGFSTVEGLVAAGVGIGIIPRSVHVESQKNCVAVPIDEPWAQRGLSVCTQRGVAASTPIGLLRCHLARQDRNRPTALKQA